MLYILLISLAFCVKRDFFLGLYDFRLCSKWRLLVVLLSTITPSFANSIESSLHDALLLPNAIAVIFRSSLGSVFLFRPHFPIPKLSISLSNSSFFLTAVSAGVDAFNSLAVPFCLRSVHLSKTVICLLFLGLSFFSLSHLANFVQTPALLLESILIPLNSQKNF